MEDLYEKLSLNDFLTQTVKTELKILSTKRSMDLSSFLNNQIIRNGLMEMISGCNEVSLFENDYGKS